MPPPRAALAAATIFRKGRAGKADLLLVDHAGARLIVKDFRGKSRRTRLLGRALIAREARAYRRLGALPGIPRFAGRIDAHALAVEFIEGMPLAFAPQRTDDGVGKLAQLRAIVDGLHRVGLVHLDLRGRENVVLDRRGRIFVVDLASAVCLRPGSWRHRWLFRWLSLADDAALLKWKTIVEAGPFTEQEQALARRFRALRPLWLHRRRAWRGGAGPGA